MAKQERKLRKKRKREATVRLASDMTPVTDRNMDGRRGWKRSRYGRAVLVMRLRKPDGTRMVYDPTMYKNNLEKLFGSVKPLPVNKLTWYYEDNNKDDDDDESEVTDTSMQVTMDDRSSGVDENEETSEGETSGDDRDQENDDTTDEDVKAAARVSR
jgi:hypothetical protein